MNKKLERLLESTQKKQKEQLQKVRKLGNTKTTWKKTDMKNATIWID